jgi:Heterokaryon incompatibility protein (HET)
MASQTGFVTLPKSPFTIHLVRLHSTESSPNREIVLSLVTFPLAKCPTYEALSYTWGPPGNEHVITVGEKATQCFDNLYRCLERIRLQRRSRLVWVNALCIRQDDLDEKADQVANVASVFSAARSVLVWVGEHADGSETIFARRSRPLSIGARFRRMRVQYYDWIGDELVANSIPGASSLPPAEKDHLKQKWSAFLARPYWSRFWILQELVVACKIIVCCGEDQLPWEKLLITWTDREGVQQTLDGVPTEYRVSGRHTGDPPDLLDTPTAFIRWPMQVKRLHRLQEMRAQPTLNVHSSIATATNESFFVWIRVVRVHSSRQSILIRVAIRKATFPAVEKRGRHVLVITARSERGNDNPHRLITRSNSSACESVHQESGRLSRLHTVHLGTFKAPRRQLQKHPPDHFDIVHLDIHGIMDPHW